MAESMNMFHASLCMKCRRNIYSRFYRNSEAFVSELLEYFDEMFPRYHQHSDISYTQPHNSVSPVLERLPFQTNNFYVTHFSSFFISDNIFDAHTKWNCDYQSKIKDSRWKIKDYNNSFLQTRFYITFLKRCLLYKKGWISWH